MNYFQSLFATALILFILTTALHAEPVKLEKGDHICLIGNALGERLQHQNSWEALLHQRFPEKQLTVRNLCFPGDEVKDRLRSLNFGSPDVHLTHSKASVIFCFFGYNESFAGRKGLPDFEANLNRFILDTKQKNYSGKAAPKIVLISPIAFQNTGDPDLDDGEQQNANLKMYAQAMSKIAMAEGVDFIDVFAPTAKLFQSTDDRLTLNGAHLNAVGYQKFAKILDEALFGKVNAPQTVDPNVKAEIDDKNFHWWHRYRAVNGYSIYGTRGKAGFDGTYRNTDVMERERAILDQMTANRDARIWQLASGKTVPEQADDSNTLPFINPKTNVGTSNKKNNKLGTLEYKTSKEQLQLFKLAEGYEINLFASEEDFPDLANPVAINFDNQGRLWVATMPSYPQWKPKTKLDDKILIFEDTDQDGQADKQTIFARGLHQPTGFEIGHNGAYVAEQPDLLFLQDTNGDDQADVRVRQVIGFDSADSHHGLAAFEWGPGGGLYFNEGTFKQSQIESPQGPVRLSDAGVWRYDPNTERFEVYASLAFANPWGHVFDKFGQSFIADASPGFNYWATPITGFVPHPDKHPGGARGSRLDWGGSEGKGSYPTFIKKRIRPSSGCELVSSRHFPPEAQGNFLLNNVIGDRAVLQHKVMEEGSGFKGEEVDKLVYCTDGNFRPVDLQFGPDGALYIVDWHNALIGHLQHNLRDPNRDKSHGRIWRVTYKGRPLVEPAKIAGQPIDQLLDLLKEPEDRTRYRVRRELAARNTEEVISQLKKWMASLDKNDSQFEHHRLEALWLCQTHNHIDSQLLNELLESKDDHVRAAATRVLSYWRNDVEDAFALIKKRINDDHPRVRLEAVRACSFYAKDQTADNEKVIEAVLDVLNHDMDDNLEYTLNETMRVLEK